MLGTREYPRIIREFIEEPSNQTEEDLPLTVEGFRLYLTDGMFDFTSEEVEQLLSYADIHDVFAEYV